MTSDPRDTSPSADGTPETPADGEVNDVLPMPQDPDDSLQTGDGVTGETSD